MASFRVTMCARTGDADEAFVFGGGPASTNANFRPVNRPPAETSTIKGEAGGLDVACRRRAATEI